MRKLILLLVIPLLFVNLDAQRLGNRRVSKPRLHLVSVPGAWHVKPDGADIATCGDSVANACRSLEYLVESRLNGGPYTVYFYPSDDGLMLQQIFKSGTNYQIDEANALTATFSAAPGYEKQIIFRVPVGTRNGFWGNAAKIIYQWEGTITFSGLVFENAEMTNSIDWFRLDNEETIVLTFQDCVFTVAGNENFVGLIISATTADKTLLFDRCFFYKGASETGEFIVISMAGAGTHSVTFQSCLIENKAPTEGPLITVGANGLGDSLTFVNNTAVSQYTMGVFTLNKIAASTAVKFTNNLIFGENPAASGCAMMFSLAAYPMTTGSLEVHNNVYWPTRTVQNAVGTFSEVRNPWRATGGQLIYGDVAVTNWMLDPKQNGNYGIGAGSLAIGRGDAADLPEKDIEGNPWTGPHIGCRANPGVTTVYSPVMPVLTDDYVGIVGDSIADGTGGSGDTDPELIAIFGSVPFRVSGLYYPNNTAYDSTLALGGQGIEEAWGLIDRAADWYASSPSLGAQIVPKYLAFEVGNNNVAGDSPVCTTTGGGGKTLVFNAAQFAAYVKLLFDKAAYWGFTPIWLGMTPSTGGDHTTCRETYNDAVEAALTAAGYDLQADMTATFILNADYDECVADGGYYNTCHDCGSGGDCLAHDVHPTNNGPGYTLILQAINGLLP